MSPEVLAKILALYFVGPLSSRGVSECGSHARSQLLRDGTGGFHIKHLRPLGMLAALRKQQFLQLASPAPGLQELRLHEEGSQGHRQP